MKEVKEMLPKDLRLKWGVKAADFDKQGRIFELYAIKSTAVSYTHLSPMIFLIGG